MLDSLLATIWAMAVFYAVMAVGTLIEAMRPLERGHQRRDVMISYFTGVLGYAAGWAAGPLTSVAAVMIMNALGAGLIPLSSDAWLFLPSVLAFVLARAMLEYWFHRAQHKFGFLWAMHSLHHSEEAFAARTTPRHFWLEALIRAALVYPFLGVLFNAPPSVLWTATLVFTVTDIGAHMNVRWHLGRFSMWIQNPQYHRIHHSTEPRHLNKNFAALTPLFDVAFGTAYRPAADEFPSTGLAPSAKPATVFETIIWPIRFQQLQASGAEGSTNPASQA